MLVFETRSTRRLVARLERGEKVLDALGEIARKHGVRAGWIVALGALEHVELVEYDQAAQRYKTPRRIDGVLEILSFVGNVSLKDGQPFVHLHAAVSRETDNGIEVLGGHVTAGTVFACEVSIECFDELTLERAHDPVTGLHLWKGAAGGTSAASASWASVAATAQAVQAAAAPPSMATAVRRPVTPAGEELLAPAMPLPEKKKISEEQFFEEPIPQIGDWIDHKQFGLCRVDGEDDDGGLVIRLPSGVRKTIKLDYLRVLPAKIAEDGRRIYPLEPRQRR